MENSIDQVLDLIGGMTVLELSELKTKFEEKFGVTAAAPMMALCSVSCLVFSAMTASLTLRSES